MQVPIVFCADKNYGLYIPVIAQSVIANSSAEHEYHLIIFDCGLKPEHIAVLERMVAPYANFRLIVHNVNAWLKAQNLTARGYWSAAVYGRFLIPTLCAEYEKVIYADIDFIFNSDIAELVEIDLGGAYIAGVIDICISHGYYDQQKRRDYFHEVLELRDARHYINAGLLVFNIKVWREQNLVEKCLAYLRKYKPDLQDQDAINSICRGRIKVLPQNKDCILDVAALAKKTVYTELDELRRQFNSAYNDERANLHYTGQIKPWHDPAIGKAEKWWHYARKTENYEILLADAIQNKAGLNLSAEPIFYKFLGFTICRVRFKPYRRRYYFFAWKKAHFAEWRLNGKTRERSFYLFGLKLWSRLPGANK